MKTLTKEYTLELIKRKNKLEKRITNINNRINNFFNSYTLYNGNIWNDKTKKANSNVKIQIIRRNKYKIQRNESSMKV